MSPQAGLAVGGLSATVSAARAHVAAPVVTAITPTTGSTAGGTPVTITGTGLAGVTAVRFGSKAARITSDTANQIVAVSPANTAGTIDVRVECLGLELPRPTEK